MKLKTGWKVCIIASSVIMFFGVLTLLILNNIWKFNFTALDVQQMGQEQTVEIKWQADITPESVEVQVFNNNEQLVLHSTSALSTVVGAGVMQLQLPYGEYQIKTTLHGKGWSKQTQTKSVKLFADEYNIAPLTGTMPVTLFTLSLNSITNNGSLPTFVWLKRASAWDFSKMPANVHLMPTAPSDLVVQHNVDAYHMFDYTAQFVEQLYKINPSSKFNFYINDYFPIAWMEAFVANNIPESNYHVTMITDGYATSSYFNEIFEELTLEQANEKYAQMLTEYNKLKEEVKQKKEYKQEDNSYVINSDNLKYYAYLMAKEQSNIDLWVSRTDTLKAAPGFLDATVLSAKPMNTLLASNTDEQKQEIKDLYSFSDDMFEQALTEGKEPMVLLGSWGGGDGDSQTYEPYFEESVKAMKAYYGDKYLYYHKGHPVFPTEGIIIDEQTGKTRADELEEAGFIVLDASIPAELFYFFNNSVIYSGLQSSTYTSIGENNVGAIFVRKDVIEANAAIDYEQKAHMFLTYVSSTDEKYGALVTEPGVNMVLEFNDTSSYHIAIYSEHQNSLTYYKQTNGTYVKI